MFRTLQGVLARLFALRADNRGALLFLQMRSELVDKVQLLKEKLDQEEKSVLRLQHAGQLGQSGLRGELAHVQSTFSRQLTQIQGSMQHTKGGMVELNEQLARERQQRAAETEALVAKLGRAQQLAEENVSCVHSQLLVADVRA